MNFDILLNTCPLLAESPKCVGWEKNKSQKLAPRMVDLSATMDPKRYYLDFFTSYHQTDCVRVSVRFSMLHANQLK